jgi:HK97 family phage major capsid protein
MFDKLIKKFEASIAANEAAILSSQNDAKAFLKLADSEDRDLTAEESDSIKEIADVTIKDLEASIAKDREELERYSKLNAMKGNNQNPQQLVNLEEEESKIIVPAVAKRHAKLQAFQGPEAEADAYASGRWLLATIGKDDNSAEWCRTHGVGTEYGAMSTTDNQLGGYTVPTPMEVSIIALREEYGVFRRNAMVESMSSDVKSISRPTGGMTATFTGEGVTVAESESQWKNIELVCRKLMALTRMSKELSEDSVVSIADQVARDVAYAFALKEDQCGFLGDGTSTYGGINGLINAVLASSTYDAATGNTAFSTLDLADFQGMVGMLPQYAEAGAKWYISKIGFNASMAALQEAAGGNTRVDIAGGAVNQFLGYPVEMVQVMNTTTAAQTSTDGLVYFGNLALAATLASRTGVSLDTSDQVYFTTDQIAIKGTERFGINIHEGGAATGDAGPIIMLATPSS